MKISFDPEARVRERVETEIDRKMRPEAGTLEGIWTAKVLEAALALAGARIPRPLLEMEAELRGISVETIAEAILDRHVSHHRRLAEVERRRLSMKERLRGTRRVEEIADELQEAGIDLTQA